MLGARKGLIVSAIAGSLVSSTAVTIVLARTARLAAGWLPLAGAAALGAAVSNLRVMALILVIDPSAIVPVGPAASMAAIPFAGCGSPCSAGRRTSPSRKCRRAIRSRSAHS
ncbi:MAG TPA: DUF4010 domain-containing protein [Pararhizobium sp.]|uniref:DUF4010 domain-containing protein n=1 Tax=Pararhizobium sp. TaxID=1977563 RepID=UPI002CDE1976|nr:DUF4010 domain-containing protein [Pararhizobium sp.]HTO33098.1 DUF4010 domain-containing protein [Pararhizobium sp.]